METTEETISEAKQIVTHLAIGLLRQDLAIQNGTASPVTFLDEQLQWGWDKLAFFCLKHGVSPPRHLPELVAWLHQPIEEWAEIGPLFAAAELYSPLLHYGLPGDLCNELSRDMHLSVNAEIEIHDLAFKQILEYCKVHYLPEQYTMARRFLVEDPYLPHGCIAITRNPAWDNNIRKWLKEAYEPIPMICRREINGQDYVALCPRCGWPLVWRTENKATCYSSLCEKLIGHLHETARWEPAVPEATRTTLGIQYSVVGPERPLLDLYRRLGEDFGLKCELWPEVDNYDLYVEFPDGERWAVDMKDVENPIKLATDIQPFKSVPEWDKAFFIFPQHRYNHDYLRTFRAIWAKPPDTEVLFVKDFIQLVREKME